jgi:hypothetical protein
MKTETFTYIIKLYHGETLLDITKTDYKAVLDFLIQDALFSIFVIAGFCGLMNGRRLINKHTNRYMYQMYDGLVLKQQFKNL